MLAKLYTKSVYSLPHMKQHYYTIRLYERIVLVIISVTLHNSIIIIMQCICTPI